MMLCFLWWRGVFQNLGVVLKMCSNGNKYMGLLQNLGGILRRFYKVTTLNDQKGIFKNIEGDSKI